MDSGTSALTGSRRHWCRHHGPDAPKTACRVIGSKWDGDSYVPDLLFSNSLKTSPDQFLRGGVFLR